MADTKIHSDQELLSQMANNDERAFAELYRRYWKKMYNTAFKRLPDHEIVKDILQDVFMNLWTRRENIDISNLNAYLFSAVRNNVLKFLEKDSRYTPIETLAAELSAVSGSPEARVLRKELIKTYQALIDTLTPSQKTIIRLRFEEDLNTADIADLLKISRKTVQNQLRTALIQIRSSLIRLLIIASLKNIF